MRTLALCVILATAGSAMAEGRTPPVDPDAHRAPELVEITRLDPSIKVDLPKAASGDETHKTTLALTLSRRPEGGYVLYVNGERTDEAQVRSLVPTLLEKDRDLQTVIAADKGIAYGDVVHIVDLVKVLGVHRFALDIEAL